MSEQLVMDWSLLERLCGDQPDFMQHLISLYVEDTRKDQAELVAAEARGELAVIERVAHRMRGAAKTMGAQRIAFVCQSLQAAASGGDAARAASELARIEHELAILFTQLDTRLAVLQGKR